MKTLHESISNLGIPDTVPVFLVFSILGEASDITSIRQAPMVLRHIREAVEGDGGKLVKATFKEAVFVLPESLREVVVEGVTYQGVMTPREQVVGEETKLTQEVEPEGDLTAHEISNSDYESLQAVKEGQALSNDDETWLIEAGLLKRENGRVVLTPVGLSLMDPNPQS